MDDNTTKLSDDELQVLKLIATDEADTVDDIVAKGFSLLKTRLCLGRLLEKKLIAYPSMIVGDVVVYSATLRGLEELNTAGQIS
jgi:hypothetical protein